MAAKVRANKGWFYVRPNRKQNSWSVYYECFENGIRQKPQRLSEIAFAELGLREGMTTEEARERVSRLNKERKLEKNTIRKSAANLEEIVSLDELLFPKELAEEFMFSIENESAGSPLHRKKMLSHFQFIQRLAIALKMYPRKYKERTPAIYSYLRSKKVSVDYSNKLIAMLNRWGRFQSARDGSYFEPVKPPRGAFRSSIAEAQKTKTGVSSERGVRVKSLPLTPTLLSKCKNRFTNEQHFNWLDISLWFGLRPNEVDDLHDSKNWEVSVDRDAGVQVLNVYQSKLVELPEEDRWKFIPILYPDQVRCLELIESGMFMRPHSKTVRKNVTDGHTCYAGRKGFVDLMLDLGQELENVSAWMGHTSTTTTRRSYKDKKRVRFTPTKDVLNSAKLKVVK